MCGETCSSGTSMRCSTKKENAGLPRRSMTIVACDRGARLDSCVGEVELGGDRDSEPDGSIAPAVPATIAVSVEDAPR